MRQIIISSVTLATLLLLSAADAEASGGRRTFGNTRHHHHDHGLHNNHGFHGGHGLHRVHLRQPRLRQIGGPIYSSPSWHDTTHLDWHPGGWQWCDGRLIYVPGHYDVHRTGHFHY